MAEPPLYVDPVYLSETFPNYVRERDDFKVQAIGSDDMILWCRGIDTVKGIPVIIQELKQIDGAKFRKFHVAVYALSLCQCPWTVQFVGFTCKPFCIVFRNPGGTTLLDYLSRPPEEELTGERFVSFIVSLAGALGVLHSHHIVLGTLRPEWISIDTCWRVRLQYFLSCQWLPMGVDISGTHGTKDPFAPPELSAKDAKIDERSDVWALATLILCMWYHLPQPPHSDPAKMKKNTARELPEGLRKLLKMCRSDKPDDRPPLQEFVNRLCEPGLLDDYVDQKVLWEMVTNMREKMRSQQNTVVPEPCRYAKEIIYRLRTYRAQKLAMEKGESLPDVNTMTVEQFREYYNRVKPSLHAKGSNASSVEMEVFRQMVCENGECLKVLVENGFFELPIFEGPKTVATTFEFVQHLVTRMPKSVTLGMKSMFVSCASWRRNDTVRLFTYFMNKFGRASHGRDLLQIMFELGDEFVNSRASRDLLAATCAAYKRGSHLEKHYSLELSNFFASFLKSSDSAVVYDAYSVLLNMPIHANTVFCPRTLTKHLQTPEFQWKTVFLLSRCRVPPEPALFRLLLAAARQSVYGFYALCNMANDKEAAERLFAMNVAWLSVPLPTFNETYKLLVAVFQHASCRQKLLPRKETTDLLKRILESGNKEFIMSLGILLKSARVTAGILSTMDSCGFFDSLLKTVQETRDDDIAIAVIACFDKLTENRFLDFNLKFLPKLTEFLDAGTLVSAAAAHHIAHIAKFAQVRDVVKDGVIPAYFERMRNEPGFESIAEQFFGYMARVGK